MRHLPTSSADAMPSDAAITSRTAMHDASPATRALHARVVAREARIGVLGLGYVGLTEAVHLAKAGYRVVGFDVDAGRVASVARGHSYLLELPDEVLGALVEDGRLAATGDFERLHEVDVILICVPTPLGKTKAPDLSFILAAVEAIRARLRAGQLVVLQSTTYPGTTREIILPALESTGLRVGVDFH